jgi:hypothetical protein
MEMSKKANLLIKPGKEQSAVVLALSPYFVFHPDWPDLRPLSLANWVSLLFMTEGNYQVVAVSHRELRLAFSFLQAVPRTTSQSATPRSNLPCFPSASPLSNFKGAFFRARFLGAGSLSKK